LDRFVRVERNQALTIEDGAASKSAFRLRADVTHVRPRVRVSMAD
jgi:hypothetical protein